MYNIEKSIENNDITSFINNKFFKISTVILGIIFSLAGASILGLWDKVNPVLISSVLFSGLFVICFFVSKCIDNKIIPYFLLQYINIWIFLNSDIFAPAGLGFKPHVIVFGISSIITFYYVLTNFKYLWSNNVFKLLLMFFVLNIIYAFFYSSDFRSSNYIDLWIQNNVGLKYASISSGFGAVSREFGSEETKFLKYLTGIIPLIAFVIGYMSFYGLKTIEEAKKKLEDIIKFFSVGYFSYFCILIFCILIGKTSLMFMENRLVINNGFTGSDFEGLILLLFIGFNLYLSNFKYSDSNKWLKYIVNINMAILSILILLGIKKGTILSFLAGFIILQAVTFFYKLKKEKNDSEKLFQKNAGNLLFWLCLPLIIALPVFLLNQDFISNIFYNLTNRFSTNSTLEIRAINWFYYMKHWADNLTWFTAVFGFGTDTSREATFFLSSMQPDKTFQQPHIHNIYLEYFYNWGLMALLYFLPPIIIFFNNIFYIAKKSVNKVIKLFSVTSVACIVFFLIYFSSESPTIQSHIIFFALLGFLESLKIAFMNLNQDEPKNNLKVLGEL